jgi:hypothetical protein
VSLALGRLPAGSPADQPILALSDRLLRRRLQNQPGRLAEARQGAEAVLAIKQTLDPAAAAIWKTYQILAEIAAQEGQVEQARTYRRLERETYAGFAGAYGSQNDL